MPNWTCPAAHPFLVANLAQLEAARLKLAEGFEPVANALAELEKLSGLAADLELPGFDHSWFAGKTRADWAAIYPELFRDTSQVPGRYAMPALGAALHWALTEEASKCYIGLEKATLPSRYMTVTFDCTSQMKSQSPAAVHVDGTARPQIVTAEDYPRFHRILSKYCELTRIPSIINTSFNMHEEPIVCSVEDAVRAFVAADLPYLVLGNFLVKGAEKVLE